MVRNPMFPPAGVRRSAQRAGFTLVELLVAAALSVLVMAVLATAFQTGIQTLSHLKSAVGLSTQLRVAEDVILRDLTAPHLEDAEGTNLRVSDLERPQYQLGAANPQRNPARGYFQIRQENDPVLTYENVEDGVPSYRPADHSLAMTVKLDGSSLQNIFVGNLGLAAPTELQVQNRTDYTGLSQFASPWAEVVYFLQPAAALTSENPDEGGGTALQLYTLRRRIRLLAPNEAVTVSLGGGQTPTLLAEQSPELSISLVQSGSSAVINSPATVTDPDNRLSAFPAGNVRTLDSNIALAGSDILLSNVISMQILVQTNETVPAGQFSTTLRPAFTTELDTEVPLDFGGNRVVLRAIQIKLRIYDVKNHMTRQMTIAADL